MSAEGDAVELVARLSDRLSTTRLGSLLRVAGLDPEAIRRYVESNHDVKRALALWYGDVKEVIHRGERTD